MEEGRTKSWVKGRQKEVGKKDKEGKRKYWMREKVSYEKDEIGGKLENRGKGDGMRWREVG